MSRFRRLTILILFFSSIHLNADIPNPLKVALMPDLYPESFVNDEGKPDGVFPRAIEEIARRNGFRIEWSIASWPENLERARNGKIDLMTALSYTEERDRYLEYGRQALISSWSQVFQARQGDVESILDIDGLKVGMMAEDQNARGFVDLAASFDIDYQAVVFGTIDETYSALKDGMIDVGVFPNIYQLSKPDLIPTSIVFQPSQSLFAVPEGADTEILDLIDRTILEWKADQNSFYNREIRSLLSNPSEIRVPAWLKYLLVGFLLLIVLTLLWLWTLRRQVRQRTADLLEAQEVYRSTFFESDVGMCHVDATGRFLRVNPQLIKMLGYRESELLGMTFQQITHPDDLDDNLRLFNDVIHGRSSSYKMDKRYRHRNGSMVWGHLTVTAVRNSDGHILYLVGIIEDITSRRNAENLVDDLEKRYRGLFENSYQLIGLFDSVGRLIDFNNTLKRVFRVRRTEDVIGRTPGEIELLGPLGSERIQEMVEGCLSTGQTIKHLLGFEETGIPMALDVTVKPIFDDTGSIRYCVAEAHDVTEMIRLTDNLEQQVEKRTREIREAQNHLIEAEKMASLGRLVAGIAHEINTPIGVAKTGTTFLADQVGDIVGKLKDQTLSREDLESSLESFAELSVILNQNLDRAIKLIQDFKMTAADQSSHEIRTVNVRQYMEAVMHSLTPQLKRSGVRWQVDAPGEELPLHVGAINQMLINFTMNSLQHGFPDHESGIITVTYRVVGTRRIFEFGDDGTGIDPSIRDKIFEPFFTTGRGKGCTGLGLSIVYNLVSEVLRGSIECSSLPRRGTIFHVEYNSEFPEAADSAD